MTISASIDGLSEALARCETANIRHEWKSHSGSKDLHVARALLSPPDVAGRPLKGVWSMGRKTYSLGSRPDRLGRNLAEGIAEGAIEFPNMCAACVGEATHAVVWEMTWVREGGIHTWEIPLNIFQGLRFRVDRRYARIMLRGIVAANDQRVWYSVPFCDTHGERSHAVAFGEDWFSNGFISFANDEYGAAFGEMNGLAARGFSRRWWYVLAGLSALLVFIGVGTLLG